MQGFFIIGIALDVMMDVFQDCIIFLLMQLGFCLTFISNKIDIQKLLSLK